MALEGDLGDFGLVDIIQLIDLGKKTGGVEIHGRRGKEEISGWVFFNEGKICGAQLGSLTGEEAVYTFFTCSSGPFKLHERVPLPPPNVRVSNEIIIMEGIGRQDEWASVAERLSGDMVLKLVPNPRSSSREINLEAHKWRVLTMINGKNTVADIARLSGLGDFTAFKTIIELMDAGLIEGRVEEHQAAPLLCCWQTRFAAPGYSPTIRPRSPSRCCARSRRLSSPPRCCSARRGRARSPISSAAGFNKLAPEPRSSERIVGKGDVIRVCNVKLIQFRLACRRLNGCAQPIC
jgi:hypothetical protein